MLQGSALSFLMFLLLWWVVGRQKTLFVYSVTRYGGEVLYQLYYPKWVKCFFKGLAISAFVIVFSMIAIMPSAILLISGAGGITIVAALTLMKWEPPPTESHKAEWASHDLVFIDRKRKLVVVSYQDNQLDGFEAHLKKEKIDEFVNFLKTVIPHAEFREAKWEW